MNRNELALNQGKNDMVNFLYTPGCTHDPYRSQLCSRQTILVVESHPTIAELLFYCLGFADYHCSVVDVSQIASLTWINSSFCSSPDGIILDVDINSVVFRSPLDFLQECYARWQTVFAGTQMLPLLLLTAQPSIYTMLQEQGYAVVMKPFKLLVLLSNLQAIIERKQETENVEARKVLPNS
jgi:DNA-binding response OmpR family regulator